ncbi:serine hydrolase [Enterococcus mundtii]|uniref:serine hydrolase n=1 Tax=Enterococcus TaxID=1350 RepID=UPI000F7CF4BA|nr:MULTISPECIES: serine hydrolase [Enterococcus]AZP93216.1 D-alanyl-D-alanine carboxypeptidase [Enterococcus mundtii]MDK4210529.1 serine hydrolase [Enterococcus mundtii]MDO7879044.1 serine hydrolase [Enterococcus mundtii]
MGTKKKYFALLLATLLLTLGSFVPTLSVQADEAFSVNSQAAFAVDATSGKILYDQDGEKTMGIASISKIIGLYIVLDQVKEGKLSWDDEVAISDYAETLSIAPNLSNVPLHKENTYTVKELFDSAFIQSANASMVALAEKISGSETAFLTVMNDQLKEWGIENATIVNVSGLNNVYLGANRPEGTGEAEENQMSAKDVAIIARHLLLDFPEVLEVTSTTTKMFGENTQSPVEMVNWNWMLPGFINFKEGVDGLKTGTTDFAGACFVGTIERDGKRIITVILNAEGHEQNPSVRFTETARLMDYCYDNWSVKEIGKANASIPSLKSIDVKNGKETSVNVVLKSPVSVWVRNDMDTGQLTITPKIDETKVKDNELEAPIVRGTKVGTATITLADDQLGYLEDGASPSTDIITASSVEKANIFVIGWRNVTNFFSNLF